MKQPLLSICIPTYNRSANLRRTLDSIVTSEGFGDEVEIVISDNASTDDTRKVSHEYVSQYPNIRYFCNETNVRDKNFTLALDRGTGQYVKLNNDNRVFLPGAVEYMLNAIKSHLIKKTPLFFTSGELFKRWKGDDGIMCNGMDDFIIHLSYWVTGIWLFGAWKDDWNNIKDKMIYSPLQLSQQDWFYQIVQNRESCILMTKEISISESIGVRKGYKWFQVQVDNYYTILNKYYDLGSISKKAYLEDHRLMLNRIKIHLVSAYLYNLLPKEYEFDMSGAAGILWKNFKYIPYFYFYLLTSPFWAIKLIIARKLKALVSNG